MIFLIQASDTFISPIIRYEPSGILCSKTQVMHCTECWLAIVLIQTAAHTPASSPRRHTFQFYRPASFALLGWWLCIAGCVRPFVSLGRGWIARTLKPRCLNELCIKIESHTSRTAVSIIFFAQTSVVLVDTAVLTPGWPWAFLFGTKCDLFVSLVLWKLFIYLVYNGEPESRN